MKSVTVDVTVNGQTWTRTIEDYDSLGAKVQADAAQRLFDKLGIPARFRVR